MSKGRKKTAWHLFEMPTSGIDLTKADDVRDLLDRVNQQPLNLDGIAGIDDPSPSTDSGTPPRETDQAS